MKIQKIAIKNFKCLVSSDFELSDNFTVLIGDNGKGKTAILDALAIGISDLLSGFNDATTRNITSDEDDATTRNITSDEVHLLSVKHGQEVNREPQYPVIVTCTGIFAGRQVTWTQSLPRKVQDQQDSQTADLSKQLAQQVSQGNNVLLPLAAYYGTDRLWRIGKKANQPIDIVPRTWGYQNCFHPDLNVKRLIEWFKKLEEQAIKQNSSDGTLEGVKSAVKECMESNWQNLTYDFGEGELIATFKDGQELPFRMLSDGVRNVLAMVVDIAYRALVLNPHLGVNAIKQTPGIVLIDEIDLHLHPSWQRKIVEALRSTFPEIQFVATTHSPFIVQSLRDGELINLDSQDLVEDTPDYYDKSIEDISEDVMGIHMPQKSERFQKMMETAEKYYRLLEEGKNAIPERIKKLKYELDKLEMPFSDNPAYHAFLKMKRESASLDEE